MDFVDVAAFFNNPTTISTRGDLNNVVAIPIVLPASPENFDLNGVHVQAIPLNETVADIIVTIQYVSTRPYTAQSFMDSINED